MDCVSSSLHQFLSSSPSTLLPAFLQERERSVTDHINLANQKQKQTEEEYMRKVHELQAELASSRETQEALERKVSYLQNDYSLLENKQSELKTTIQNLLQSRESFLTAYQESFCEMNCSIEARDRKIAILHEKITSHLALFDSIEKEASVIKKVIHQVQDLVDQKEDVVAGLKEKMDHVSTYEKVFIENIRALEEKLEYHETELQSKENIISELSAQLESEKIKNEHQHQVEELQKTLQVKDLAVENLISEKEALYSEVKGLEMILQRIQESVSLMTEEDRKVFTSILTFEQGSNEKNKRSRHNDTVDKMEELLCEAPVMHSQENSVKVIPSASPRCQHQNTDCRMIQDDDHQLDSAEYLLHNTVSGHWQSTNNHNHFEIEDKYKELMNQPDSECSTNRV
ncbi:myosin-11 isoform X1 [Arabidopsis lyrata subsp. lyrata]|uniref:myosin-11 isoform X1 n=1 Tax=Arabidopsis lyrata subsp. lyrata TaxID=81972 RepID=UPI000A29E13C|nr:myosin-11 isoform X1 [Arabidopsis lyrata subsp. lyrata]XP_020866020.1 myosin-11 isoform X1 [Arabidopsis lyrata subsp. lyrata]XP_020866021.1 myosin-11 isoform X1 [Arabidopsis lyrata subsp. lyrata]XP_020866022.1 myosin-11 isoform X1 [Arabidopsis lyrata subsp. lyrata]|eukprot:XP_020866019.1 myosin-11 isoform X1 [Arabidopsis lyrata subsp. lyrata]